MNEEMIDDFMPNEAGSAGLMIDYQDDETTQEINEERARVTGAAPLIDEIGRWFDTEIARISSVEALDAESRVSIEAQVIAMQQATSFLRLAKNRLDILRGEHLPN